jgi:guanine deaminase
MPRPLSERRRAGRVACLVVALAVVPIVAFSSGLWVARSSQAPANEDRSIIHRGVSEKIWVTADEVEARFTAEKHREFMRRAVANSRLAGVEKRAGGPSAR